MWCFKVFGETLVWCIIHIAYFTICERWTGCASKIGMNWRIRNRDSCTTWMRIAHTCADACSFADNIRCFYFRLRSNIWLRLKRTLHSLFAYSTTSALSNRRCEGKAVIMPVRCLRYYYKIEFCSSLLMTHVSECARTNSHFSSDSVNCALNNISNFMVHSIIVADYIRRTNPLWQFVLFKNE